MKRLVARHDDALPSPLFQGVLRAMERIGAKADYWRTFWYPLATEPRNQVEAIARTLQSRVPEGERIAGVEWWLGRMNTRDVPLDFHHDRDLSLFEQTGRLAHPKWSSVLYLNEVTGGSLVVTDQRLLRRGEELRLSPPEAGSSDVVRPAANRFVVFPGNLFHGVLDADDAVPHGTLAGKAEWRLSVVLNWWTRKPRGVRRWSASDAYPELSR